MNIQEVYERYAHLDMLMSDGAWLPNSSIGQILLDCWQAIAENAKGCQWIKEGDHFETSCGNAFQFCDSDPADNNFKFCPYCGRRLVEEL